MTRRRDLDEHRRKLDEIHDIMNSMKTLAYMETRKLGRVLETQQKSVADIEAMASDFVSFFPDTLPADKETMEVYLLLGSERGFCGNFNESLLPVMESCIAENAGNEPILIAIGHKLHTALENEPRLIASIDGANVMEEIEAVLMSISETFNRLQAAYPALSLYVIYHSTGQGEEPQNSNQQVIMQKLIPPFQRYQGKQAGFSYPPILNVAPADFLLELTDHYLFAALHEILYTSLMAENYRRVQHLEGAVEHLEDKAKELTSQSNALRQEEIIEEIEVILLSSTNIDSGMDIGLGHTRTHATED
jgi:F-type H+-transporting ATPase subunit gamma